MRSQQHRVVQDSLQILLQGCLRTMCQRICVTHGSFGPPEHKHFFVEQSCFVLKPGFVPGFGPVLSASVKFVLILIVNSLLIFCRHVSKAENNPTILGTI